jgi:hypothetical protein
VSKTTYELACEIVVSWPAWKRRVMRQSQLIKPEMKKLLRQRKEARHD